MSRTVARAAGRARLALVAATVAGTLGLAACSLPGPGKPIDERTWLLEDPDAAAAAAAPASRTVLRVSPARAAPGFNTANMLYRRTPARLERFAWQVWADTPAAMLTALIAARLDQGGTYRAVLTGAADVPADVRLDLHGCRLLQTFDGARSAVTLELRAQLLALPERRLLAARHFAYRVAADSATPEAGVAAANAAVGKLLDDLQAFTAAAMNE
ncbi:MAG TPA: ABC-type transport auxiliary lipoprotein family protein [Woeseiaceae bacterium]|nr:ABC-type transport auxiliary lipoprotein family protein [Woeseiaceae bacterium]